MLIELIRVSNCCCLAGSIIRSLSNASVRGEWGISCIGGSWEADAELDDDDDDESSEEDEAGAKEGEDWVLEEE